MSSGSQFEAAIRDDFEASRGHPQFGVWLDYALSANERGETLLSALGNRLPRLKGKRHLDIGAGYGGACVAAARRGAESFGLELDERLLGFAAANKRDHPQLSLVFRKGDALDRDCVESLGKFDLVTCDNVIEHVRSPERLIAHFRLLLAPGGLLYVTIPNAFSVEQVRKECHYGQFGLSLLDPLDGSAFVGEVLGNPSYDVSDYFRFESYQTMFQRYGLTTRLVAVGDPSELEAVFASAQGLTDEFERCNVPARLRAKVQRRLENHLMRFESELLHWRTLRGRERLDVGRGLMRDYSSEVWAVISAREDRGLVVKAVKEGERVARGLERLVRRLVKRR